jgi:aryl-alcohol dehydrogenase-like predicted oxidoreductase
VVSTVIPGMRRPAHVEENCTVPDAPTLTPEELEELKAHAWPRNFYQ